MLRQLPCKLFPLIPVFSPIKYVVNGHHCLSFAVRAEVVPVTLSMSTCELTVMPSPGLPVDAGSRGVVTLTNEYNLAAKFTWTPVVGEVFEQ